MAATPSPHICDLQHTYRGASYLPWHQPGNGVAEGGEVVVGWGPVVWAANPLVTAERLDPHSMRGEMAGEVRVFGRTPVR